MGKQKDNRPFSERHPRWNFVIGLVLLLALLSLAILVLYLGFKYIGVGIGNFVDWLKEIASKLDAVVDRKSVV